MTVSIITAVFNNAQHIASCLESIHSQSWPGIEHIIIDGGSTDGTLQVIEEVMSRESRATSQKDSKRVEESGVKGVRVISEPDNGIYDALNKGIKLATGDVIGFLHADDIYADKTVIEKVAKAMTESNVDSCYGDLVYVKDSEQAIRPTSLQAARQDSEQANKPTSWQACKPASDSRFTVVRYWKSGPYEKGLFKKGWMPPHPTFFVRREVYRRLGAFDTGLRIAADYELMLRFLWENDISTCYIPEVLIKMRTGGASNGSLRNILKKSAEDYKAMRMHGAGGLATLVRKNLSKIPQFFKGSG